MQDKLILDSYSDTIDGLAAYLGEAFEIVLHNLVDLDHSIIKIVNGHHSGRKEGSPITDFALSMLERIRKDNDENGRVEGERLGYTTYISSSKYGHPVRSSTIVIFGKGHEAIGLLCINLYLDAPISALSELINNTEDSPVQHITENFINNSKELIAKALETVRDNVMTDNEVPAGLKNKEIVTQLYYQGIFKMKDAVITVARGLNISKNTVYLHLRALEKKDEKS
jgi:predicted transcriptional regulator YheO